MSDDKTVSERDAVLREREAFVNGWRSGWNCTTDNFSGAQKIAAKTFPLPKVTRPRVLTLKRSPFAAEYCYRIAGNVLEWRSAAHSSDEWVPCRAVLGDSTLAFLVTIGELAADPNELVDDDSASAPRGVL